MRMPDARGTHTTGPPMCRLGSFDFVFLLSKNKKVWSRKRNVSATLTFIYKKEKVKKGLHTIKHTTGSRGCVCYAAACSGE